MKKRSLIILTVVLTLVFAMFTTSVAYAADGETAEQFSQKDLITMIVTYCVFGVAVLFGIPAIRAVNKRKKKGYVDAIVKETESITKKLEELYAARTASTSAKDNLKFSFKISAVADMALTTYTQKQVGGYYELYNELNDVKTKLSELSKDDKNYDETFAAIITASKSAAAKAAELAENENIIRQYNK